MTVYVDVSAAADPDLGDRLGHLVEAGHQLVLVAPGNETATGPGTWPGWAFRLTAMPPEREPGSWYLTADPTTCGDRVSNLHTVLIGPRVDDPGPTRCDSTARDLRQAVLGILGAEAMG
jgi:hypothetical protein